MTPTPSPHVRNEQQEARLWAEQRGRLWQQRVATEADSASTDRVVAPSPVGLPVSGAEIQTTA